MKKQKILKINSNKSEKKVIRVASKIIENNGIVIFPTETVYGIGTLMGNRKIIKKLYHLRKRPKNKALLILIANKKELFKYAFLTSQAKQVINKFWPGPLTLILLKKKTVPSFITANQRTIAIRMPESKFLLALIKKLKKPIVAPSANITGKKSPITAKETFKDFLGKVDLILDGGRTKYQKESTILDLTQKTPVILREGAVSRNKLKKYLT